MKTHAGRPVPEREARNDRERELVERLRHFSKRIHTERNTLRGPMSPGDMRPYLELRSAWTLTMLRAKVRKILDQLASERDARRMLDRYAESRIERRETSDFSKALGIGFGAALGALFLGGLPKVAPPFPSTPKESVTLSCTGCGALRTKKATATLGGDTDLLGEPREFPICDTPPACECGRGRWRYVR